MAKEDYDLTWLIGPIAGILGIIGLAIFGSNNNNQSGQANQQQKTGGCGCQHKIKK